MQSRHESRQSKFPALPKIRFLPSSWRSSSNRKSTIPRVVVPVVGPAGQRPCLLAHVVLGVAVRCPEREQLHHLAPVVLVRSLLLVLVAGEPDEHRRIGRHVEQQVLERAQRVLAEQLVLIEVERHLADVGGREPVMPGQRHPLDQRLIGADHPVEPPEQIVAPRIGGRQGQAVIAMRLRALETRLAVRAGQRVNGPAQALARELRRLAGRRPEAGTPKQALGLLGTEAASIGGDGHGYPIRQPAAAG